MSLLWRLATTIMLACLPLAADTVSGYVLDTQTEQRLVGIEVAFLVGGEEGLTEMVRRRTDEEGAFSFSGPFLTPGTTFVLVAHHEGLEYDTEPLQVGMQDQVIIEVFDGTEDDGQIRLDGHHLFLAITKAGVDVAQLVHIDNDGASTYIGRAFGDERRVFQMQVPAGSLAPQGHSGQVLRAGPTRLFTTTPLPPGRSQIAFTIQLRGDDFDGSYEHEVLYPTSRLEVFVQPTDIELPASQFEDHGEIHLHDQGYRHYRMRDLDRGRTVAIPLPYSQPLRWSLKWAMLVLVPALLAAAVALTRPAAAAPPAGATRSQCEQLIAQLADIDDRLDTADERGAFTLQQQRQQLKKQVTLLYRQLDDTTG